MKIDAFELSEKCLLWKGHYWISTWLLLLFFHEDRSQIPRYRRDRCLHGKRESVSWTCFLFHRASRFGDEVWIDGAHNWTPWTGLGTIAIRVVVLSFCEARSALSGSGHSDRSAAFSWAPPHRIVAAGVALIKRRCRCLVTRHLPFVFAFVFVRPQRSDLIYDSIRQCTGCLGNRISSLWWIFSNNLKYMKSENVIYYCAVFNIKLQSYN